MTLWILRRHAKLLLEGLPRFLGVGVHVCSIPLQGAGLNEAEAPGSSVVIERARRQPQQKPSLLVVEDPDEILVGRHMGHEDCRLDRRGPEIGPRSGKIALVQKQHGLSLDEREIGGRERETPVEGFPRLGIAPKKQERLAEPPLGQERAGIEALRLLAAFHRLLPAPEDLFDEAIAVEKICVAGATRCPRAYSSRARRASRLTRKW